MPPSSAGASRAPSSPGGDSGCSSRAARVGSCSPSPTGCPGSSSTAMATTSYVSSCRPVPKLGASTIVELLAELCSPRGIYERSEGGGRHKEGLASRRGRARRRRAAARGRGRRRRHAARRRHRERSEDRRVPRSAAQPRARSCARRATPRCSTLSPTPAALPSRVCAPARRRATLVDSSAEALALAERETAANGVRDALPLRRGERVRRAPMPMRAVGRAVRPRRARSAEIRPLGRSGQRRQPRLQGHQHARARRSSGRAGCSRRSRARATSTRRCFRRSSRVRPSTRGARRRSSNGWRNRPITPSRPSFPKRITSKA